MATAAVRGSPDPARMATGRSHGFRRPAVGGFGEVGRPAPSELEKEVRPLFAVHDAGRDQESLVELAAWCEQFSPIVGLDQADEPDSLLMDISGLAHLFGGEEALAQTVVAACQQQGLTVRVAIADTVSAAWGFARWGEMLADGTRSVPATLMVLPPGDAAVLDCLPVEALRLPHRPTEQLHRLGIRRIGQLNRLPRASLAARFGEPLIERLDQTCRHDSGTHRGAPCSRAVVGALVVRASDDAPRGDRTRSGGIAEPAVAAFARTRAGRLASGMPVGLPESAASEDRHLLVPPDDRSPALAGAGQAATGAGEVAGCGRGNPRSSVDDRTARAAARRIVRRCAARASGAAGVAGRAAEQPPGAGARGPRRIAGGIPGRVGLPVPALGRRNRRAPAPRCPRHRCPDRCCGRCGCSIPRSRSMWSGSRWTARRPCFITSAGGIAWPAASAPNGSKRVGGEANRPAAITTAWKPKRATAGGCSADCRTNTGSCRARLNRDSRKKAEANRPSSETERFVGEDS